MRPLCTTTEKDAPNLCLEGPAGSTKNCCCFFVSPDLPFLTDCIENMVMRTMPTTSSVSKPTATFQLTLLLTSTHFPKLYEIKKIIVYNYTDTNTPAHT